MVSRGGGGPEGEGWREGGLGGGWGQKKVPRFLTLKISSHFSEHLLLKFPNHFKHNIYLSLDIYEVVMYAQILYFNL